MPAVIRRRVLDGSAIVRRCRRYPRRGLPLLALLALAVLVFGQVLSFDFLSWDDNYNITENPRINPPFLTGLVSFWKAPFLGLYAPLSYSFFMLEAATTRSVAAAGMSVSPQAIFHAGSLMLHLGNVLLVYQVVSRLTGHRSAALIGAAVFAVHPLQVESVAWITETRGLLSSNLSLSALCIYWKYVHAPPTSRIRRLGLLAAGVICASLALLAKPSAASIPLFMLILGSLSEDKRTRSAIGIVITSIVAFAILIVTRHLQPAAFIADTLPIGLRPFVALDALALYLLKVIVPIGLGPDYGWRPSVLVEQAWFYFLWTVPAVAGFVLWKRSTDWRIRAGLLLFVAGLAPTLGFVSFGFQEISLVADRYAYLGMFGIALAIAQFMASRWNQRTLCGAGLAITVLAVLSFAQARHWKNDHDFFARMLTINPRSFAAYTNVGARSIRAGDVERGIALCRQALRFNSRYAIAWFDLGTGLLRSRNYPGARAAFERANILAPNKTEILNNLGRAMLELNRPIEALGVLREAVKADPTCGSAFANLADALMQSGDLAAAEAQFQRAIELAPGSADARYQFAELRRRQWRLDSAQKLLDEAICLNPNSPAFLYARGEIAAIQEDWGAAEGYFASALQLNPNLIQARFQLAVSRLRQQKTEAAIADLGLLREQYPNYLDTKLGLAQAACARGDPKAAIRLFEEALATRPGWPTAQRMLAWIYATAGDERVRNGTIALSIARELNESPKAHSAELLDLLAAAEAEEGCFQEAARIAADAAELAKERQQFALANRIDGRLALYRRGQPYRDSGDHPEVATRVANSAKSLVPEERPIDR